MGAVSAISANQPSSALAPHSPRRRSQGAREALVEAAQRLLPDRAPSAITGRDLASEAHVNYGLVHHYFGGKDAVLEAGLAALRDDFVREYGDGTLIGLLTGDCHPYLRAMVRSQVDYPDTVLPGSDFPIGAAMVSMLAPRVAKLHGGDLASASAEAKARVIAMTSIQLCYGVFGAALLDSTGVGHRERSNVERELSALYDSLALAGESAGSETT